MELNLKNGLNAGLAALIAAQGLVNELTLADPWNIIVPGVITIGIVFIAKFTGKAAALKDIAAGKLKAPRKAPAKAAKH